MTRWSAILFAAGTLGAGLTGIAAEPTVRVADFRQDPVASGWSRFGDPELFRWLPDAEALEVTWDSGRPNSYFELPLGTTLTRRDDFRAEIEVEFDALEAGVDPAKPGPFQIAFGFRNQAEARLPGFLRGTATDSPDLVEFSFFPDTGFGATLWPAVFSTNSVMNYRGAQDYSLFDLPLRTRLKLGLTYAAGEETATLSVTGPDGPVGPDAVTQLTTRERGFSRPFTDFRVDSFAIASYSDDGQPPDYGGSVHAHAVVRRITVTTPPPPIRSLSGRRGPAGWEMRFDSLEGWRYQLQRSFTLGSWENLGAPVPGTGATLQITDAWHSGTGARLYRVTAERAIP